MINEPIKLLDDIKLLLYKCNNCTPAYLSEITKELLSIKNSLEAVYLQDRINE